MIKNKNTIKNRTKPQDTIIFVLKLLILLFLLGFPSTKNAFASELSGLIIRVSDGDTIILFDDEQKQHKIRLADIDAPEKGQPYSDEASAFLTALVDNKEVTAECRSKDRYKCDICTVYVDGLDVNAELIRTGHAWVFTKYNKRDDLPNLQKAARASKRGLWGLSEAENIEPGQWRKVHQ